MLFALCLTSFQAHAQRYLPGMKGLQVTAGMTDEGIEGYGSGEFPFGLTPTYMTFIQDLSLIHI